MIEKNIGPAHWERDHPEMGPDTFPLYLNEGAIFPMAWCTKRLYDGPGDDLWSKFSFIVLKEEVPPKKPGLLGRLFGK